MVIQTEVIKRSSYPFISIGEAITIIEKLKKAEGYTYVPVSVFNKIMGYSSTSSNPARILSALLGYGLLGQQGTLDNKRIQLSGLAKKILLNPENSTERQEAIREAVFNEPMVMKALEQWPNGLPSKANIERTLQLVPFNFSERAAKRFSSVLSQNFAAVNLTAENIENENDLENQGVPFLSQVENEFFKSKSEKKAVPPGSSLTESVLNLEGGTRKVVLQTPTNLTEDEFEYILDWMKLIKRGLVKKSIVTEIG